MTRGFVAFALAFAAFLPLAAGCAADEAEAGEAAYPTAVGYTPPPSEPPPRPAQSSPPGDPAAMGADPASPPGAPPSQVVVGDGNDDNGDGVANEDESGPPGDAYADTDPSALNDFRSTLDPYGTWADDPNYGTVWVPSQAVVGDDFAPYVSGGHWAYDDDYTWVSDYDWGWAPFHYGRWVYGGRGWSWIPGRAYSGAWVSWRYGAGDYVGWGPMAPSWCWRGGRSVALNFVPRVPYAFVGSHNLFVPSLGSHLVVGPEAAVIGARTRPWVVARPGVGQSLHMGPPPSTLNIASTAVVRSSGNPGLAEARAFARPSTARALGASAPRAFGPREVTAGWSARGVVSTQPAYPSVYSSHFGGRLGAGFRGSATSAPPTRSIEGTRPYYGSMRGGPSYGPGSGYRSIGGGPSYGGGYRGPVGGSMGGYRGPVGGSMGGGGYARPSAAPAPAAGGFRSGGGFSGGGSVFHGSGGGGGGSRGGGRGGRR